MQPRTTQLNCDEQLERKYKRWENLCLVFLVPVMFVSADVVHQVPLFILVFITVFSVLQEVKRLEDVAWAPVQNKELSKAHQTHTESQSIVKAESLCEYLRAPLAVFATFCSIYQMLQVLVLHRPVLLGGRQAEQRANPLCANVQDGVRVPHLLKVPAQGTEASLERPVSLQGQRRQSWQLPYCRRSCLPCFQVS